MHGLSQVAAANVAGDILQRPLLPVIVPMA